MSLQEKLICFDCFNGVKHTTHAHDGYKQTDVREAVKELKEKNTISEHCREYHLKSVLKKKNLICGECMILFAKNQEDIDEVFGQND